jgi:peptidoglycan/LPS O-acetylase OafA/YrhL
LSHQLKYRPHIDGLRAIAVASVVLFHLGVDFLPGGFAGVDIFFVISGFLISRIIYTESGAGEFSVVRFYGRRARRILPAFFAVTTLTFVGAFFLFLPPEFEAFARSVLASVVFAPNIFFYMTADYFAPAAETMPLLHYWSLGVEEQFYFVFPLIILGIVRVAPRALALSLGVLLALSLAASEAALRFDPQAAFYLLPFRAYELLIGCLIALPGIKFPTSARIGAAATGLGLAMILAAFLILTKDTRFPGVAALLPTVGAGLVLWGSDKAPNMIARLLSTPSLVRFGLISYSLYLVHWPLILFATRLYPYADPLPRGAAAFGLSVVLATISYWLIERPFRRNVWSFTRRRIFWFSGSGLAVLGALSGFVLHHNGFPGRLDARINDILAFQSYDLKPQFRSGVCFLNPEQPGGDIDLSRCLPKGTGRKAILWGDSAAAHLYSGLREPLEAMGYSLGQLTASACAPVEGWNPAQRPNCRGFNEIALPKILTEKPDLLVMAARWPITDELLDKLDATISKLNKAGIQPVILGAPILYKAGVPALLVERLKAGNQDPFSGPDLIDSFITNADEALSNRLRGRDGVKFASIFNSVCPTKQCPMIVDGKTPLHFDSLHLTEAGSKFFAKALLPEILH